MKTRTQILKMASTKMRVGAHKYGKWSPDKDKRNFTAEAIDELLDCINYCIMQIQRLYYLNHEGGNMKKKNGCYDFEHVKNSIENATQVQKQEIIEMAGRMKIGDILTNKRLARTNDYNQALEDLIDKIKNL